jgi:hypothetical protein
MIPQDDNNPNKDGGCCGSQSDGVLTSGITEDGCSSASSDRQSNQGKKSLTPGQAAEDIDILGSQNDEEDSQASKPAQPATKSNIQLSNR